MRRPDIVEQVIRLSVRAAAEMKKQGVLMHTSITFGPLPRKCAQGKPRLSGVKR